MYGLIMSELGKPFTEQVASPRWIAIVGQQFEARPEEILGHPRGYAQEVLVPEAQKSAIG